MNHDQYQIKSGEALEVFEFTSIGVKGKIPKLVQYSRTNYRDLYNLAFGDKNIDTWEIDDLAISNNGDSEKVLATVVATLYAFFDKHPNAMVYATGSTKARTRLYRMGISKYYTETARDFEIFGERNKQWESFEKDTDYKAFLVRLK